MSANTHRQKSQQNALALNTTRYHHSAVPNQSRPRQRRRRRGLRLPLWQAGLLLTLLTSIVLIASVWVIAGYVRLALSAYTVYDQFTSGAYALLSEESAVGESVRYTGISIAAEPVSVEANDAISGVSYAWPEYITRWNSQIAQAASARQLDVDLVASIVEKESTGKYYAVSYAGAVGLMGVMPYGPGFYDRPTSDRLVDPAFNLEVGTGILLDLLRLTEYDLKYALAAYNGGLGYAQTDVPQFYAEDILEQYARIVATRAQVDPEDAFDWTLGYEVWRDGVVTYYNQSPNDVEPIGAHTVFQETLLDGSTIEIIGYAVPIGTFLGDSP